MASRLVRVPVQHQLEVLADHVRHLQAERSVLVVTTKYTTPEMRAAFDRRGVDAARVFIIDAVGSKSGALVSDDPEHLMYVTGPHQLELMALRTLKVIQAKAERKPHIVVCTANSFAQHNSPAACQEIVQHILQVMLHPRALFEIVVEDGVPLDAGLQEFLERSLDGRINLTGAPL